MRKHINANTLGCLLTFLMGLFFTTSAIAQNGSKSRQEMEQETHKNWQRMLNKLDITLPDYLPPPSEDPNRPDGTFKRKNSNGWTDSAGYPYARGPWGKWTNYDESKANPYDHLPDPLKLDNGKRVTNKEIWWNQKRPEIKKAFTEEIFGRVPDNVPDVKWEVTSTRDTTIGDINAVQKKVMGHVDNSSYPAISVNIQLSVITPENVEKAVPVIMHFGYRLPPGFHFPKRNSDKPSWKEQLLNQGWGYAVYMPQSVQADNGAGLTKGIIGLVNKGQPRSPDDWGALRAWAWGASRSLDYLETDEDVNAKKVGLEGLSRLGKAVLVTMAYDQRFAIVLVGSSGKGGAALYRRNHGETIGILSSSGEYHWFAGNFIAYAGPLDANDLKVDSHELIAMCAPRPLFISCGSPKVEGPWVDDKGQFMAEVAAGPVYKLLGKKGLGTDTMPPMGKALLDGDLAFRQHFGPHTDVPNWPYFIKFAKRYFK